MSAYLARRLAALLATLAVASVVIFAALDWLPGNAAQVMLGPDAAPDAVAALAAQLGLDQPAPVRYLRWLAGLAHGDMGQSYAYGVPVAGLIAERLALTAPLALLAMAFTTVIALAVGLLAAARHGRASDTALMALAQLGVAVPSFWLAMLLILVFSVRLHWFAAGGFDGWGTDIASATAALRALVLPALALAAVQSAILARITRAALLEVAREDFVRTARAKGLSRAGVLWRHVLRNAALPIVTVMGLQFAELLAGAVVVENVFYLPGLGRLVFQAIANRDLVVVRNCVLVLVALVVVVNFAVEVLYAAIDPRLRSAAR